MVKIVFLGSGPYVIPILEMLRVKYNLVLVLTTEQNKTDPVPAYCIKHAIPYLSVSDISDPNLQSLIVNHKSDLGVLAYFGLILPKKILEIFPKGILNTHPSLLSKYRGPTPGQMTILHGDKVTGVTLIKLDTEIDHGPIIDQITQPVKPYDTAKTLYKRLFKIGAELLDKNIKKFIEGKGKLSIQKHEKATFTPHLSRQDGYIDIENPPSSEKLDRMIRAFYPWPGVWTRFNEKIVKLLPNDRIQVEGKKPMTYKDFVNGYPEGSKLLEKLKLEVSG